MRLIFDIGMYDGADTAYFLELGARVVAVEANPALVEDARVRFAAEIAAGRLTCVNAAITECGEACDLQLSSLDPGSNSLFAHRVSDKGGPVGSVHVPGTTLSRLLGEHGRPDYLKVDIEGADRLCVLALARENRPQFLSFEVGPDVEELIAHAVAIGYTRFKAIHQTTFRELDNHLCLQDRIAMRVVHVLGYAQPNQVRRAGRFFVRGRSSGPVPWRSDGDWHPAGHVVARLRAVEAASGKTGWYDVHATAD